LANHAGPDGTGAFPSVATLVQGWDLNLSLVRDDLDSAALAVLPGRAW
jgi:hypothetical protein